MSRKYKFTKDTDHLFFVTFTISNWIDLFVREEYCELFLDSVRYCQKEKDLIVYAWVIMPSHVHMIIGSHGKDYSDIMRDLKRFTAEKLHIAIKNNIRESRKEWILWMMERAGKLTKTKFQLWQPESHPVILDTNEIIDQRLNYLHNNPVVAGFVSEPHYWKYSSACDYMGQKGIIDIFLLDNELASV